MHMCVCTWAQVTPSTIMSQGPRDQNKARLTDFPSGAANTLIIAPVLMRNWAPSCAFLLELSLYFIQYFQLHLTGWRENVFLCWIL